jgi:serine/threonine-protein kinase
MPELPTTFGKYYLTEKLATGGMAEIYLAKLIGPGGFEKQLVIKQILPRLSGQQQFVDLFVAEAKILVTLAHGNIVPVYELGVVDDTYFIAMEYIDGPTLYRLTERMAAQSARMDPPVAAWIAARVLEGLDYAHRKGEGVIHRDLSPRNVMLSRDGEVKLVDFGIAVALGEPGDDSARESAPTGSFPYMSPEQVRREPLTGQTDLFSAGVLCWEMLTGTRLFARGDADATLAAVLGDDIPPPSSRRDEIPPKLDEVVMRALERDRTERWQTAGDMLAELNRYIYGLTSSPGPREVGSLVARFCPPETRRQPTHVETPTADAVPAGPSTAVIPRDGSQPKGKRPKRAQTFATHIELAHMLERATTSSEPPREDTTTPKPIASGAPPSRALLITAGVGASALAIAAVIVFLRGREAVMRAGDSPVRSDARAIVDTLAAPPPDISEPPPDVAEPIDAPAARPDTAARPIIDAAPLATKPDAAIGSALLKIGADPWGEIAIDGVARGTTPKELTVSAGHHEIVIENPALGRKQTFAVDLATGETKQIQADFK